MQPRPTIGYVMTPFPHFIERDQHVTTAKTMLDQLRIHHLPVRDGDRMVGVITDQDLRQAEALGLNLSISSNVRVADVCAKEVFVVDPDEPLDEVLMQMAERHVDAALIMKNGKLAGIFTVTDACRQFAKSIRSQSGATA